MSSPPFDFVPVSKPDSPPCESNPLTPEELALGISAEEMGEVEDSLMQRKIKRVDWGPIIYLYEAVTHIELSDRKGRSQTFSMCQPQQEVVTLLQELGCTLVIDEGSCVTTMSWTNINKTLFSLVHDILFVIREWWYYTMSGQLPQWFVEYMCPLGVDTAHVIWICKFLARHEMEIFYFPADDRVIPRLTLFFGGKPDYRRFDQFQLNKVHPIEQLYPKNSVFQL
jgi:hypothetical protein